MEKSRSFVSIGAGNVASHLARGLCRTGCRLLQVYSPSGLSAETLAEELGSVHTDSLSELTPDADFYLVSVPDHALRGLLDEFPAKDGLVFHTAGTVGLEVFGKEFSACGVMYPLQTFTRDSETDLSVVPFLTEASDPEALAEINSIACLLSPKVYSFDPEKRRMLHLAAVFACNFTNHMYTLANEILEAAGAGPSLLDPLISETFRKSRAMDPLKAQTGPASRFDRETMEKHIKMLEAEPLMQKIYTFTSQSIQSKISRGKKNTGK